MTMSADTAEGPADEELKRVFMESDDPALSAPEVAGELGISQQAAHSRLTRAAERGEIERKKVGARAVVWWLPGYSAESL